MSDQATYFSNFYNPISDGFCIRITGKN